MESNKNSAYSMLMTVLFYTTGSICALRATAWLAARTFLPIASHILSHYYRRYRSHAAPPPSPTNGGAAAHDAASPSAGEASGAAAGLFFKLVRTAAGHDLFVPVPIGLPHTGAGGSGASMILLFLFVVKFILFSAFVGACGVAAYHFAAQVRNSARSKSRKLSTASRSLPAPSSSSSRSIVQPHTSSAGAAAGSAAPNKSATKLNPAAPVFTPSPPAQRLDPTARAFTSRGWGGEEDTDSAPASPADSVGPATPSPVRSAFAFAARVAARGRSSGGKQALPVGVGKMRVVRPEEVVIGERRAGEVFVFF